MPHFEPIEHDPFEQRPVALLPVDHNPFDDLSAEVNAPQMPQFTPGSREWYANQVYGTGVPADVERQRAESAEFIGSMMPVLGESMALRDAWNASGRGGEALMSGDFGKAGSEYLGMLGDLGGALLPFSVNKLTRAAMPADPKNTTMTFAGPTAKTAAHSIPDEFKYIRRTRGGNPDTGVGYMMFLDSGGNIDDAAESLASYGKNIWQARPINPVRAEDIHDDVVKALNNRPDLLREYQATAEQLASEMMPSDIVNSAGFWDAPNLVEAVWQDVLEPRGALSVLTPDGMILFDPSGVKPYR